MLPARLFFRNAVQFQFVRSLSYTPIRKMPFSKHEVVPDVIPTAPKNVAKVEYKSGGEKKYFKEQKLITKKIKLFCGSFGEFGECFDANASQGSTKSRVGR